MILNFGKHKGESLCDIPLDYLVWLIDTRTMELDRFREELTRRRQIAEADSSIAERLVTIGYRELAKKLHPDVGGTSEDMKALNSAREWLKNAVNRFDGGKSK